MTKRIKFFVFAPIFAGFLFFGNPYFAAIDILPDFIGCLLICLGLTPLARISAPMYEARRSFLYLAAADAAKNVLLMAVFGISSPVDRSTMMLTLALAGTVLGLLFMIPAFKAFFDGLEYLALSDGCPYLYEGGEHRSRCERMKRFTLTFVIIREVLCLLPEFAALLNSSYVDSNMTFLYDYIGVMRLLACIPVVVIGTVWLLRILTFFVKVLKETDFCTAVLGRYTAYADVHPGTRVKSRHGTAFLLLTVGGALTADFYLDFKNILPDGLAAFLMIAGLLCLQISVRSKILGTVSCAAYGVVALLSTRYTYSFIMNHTTGAIAKDEAAAAAYFAMWGSALAEMIAFLIFLLFLCLALRETVKLYAGYRPEYLEEGAFESRSILRLREEFDKRFITCYILGFFSAIASFLYDYIKEWPKDKSYRFLEFLWIPDLLLAVAFAVYLGYLLSLIYQQIKAKYQYE